jgi:hypothetical protein
LLNGAKAALEGGLRIWSESVADAVHRWKVGDIEVTVLTDGFRNVPVDGEYW